MALSARTNKPLPSQAAEYRDMPPTGMRLGIALSGGGIRSAASQSITQASRFFYQHRTGTGSSWRYVSLDGSAGLACSAGGARSRMKRFGA